jgi:hypothetical protein
MASFHGSGSRFESLGKLKLLRRGELQGFDFTMRIMRMVSALPFTAERKGGQ